jgi:hypothetical protein
MKPTLGRWVLVALLAGAAGCGTLRTGEVFGSAADRLEAIRVAGLEQREAYRLTLARGFLDLAREARGRGDYDEALRFARRSLELSDEVLRSPRRILEATPVEAVPGGR